MIFCVEILFTSFSGLEKKNLNVSYKTERFRFSYFNNYVDTVGAYTKIDSEYFLRELKVDIGSIIVKF